MPDLQIIDRFLEGQVLQIDKELNWTSFDAVNKIRILLKQRLGIKKIKVGHAGTLDPLATGLIIVCTGRMTKRITGFQDLDKEYEAVLKLGETTPSFDLESETDYYYPTEHITREDVISTLEKLKGEIYQVPPLFSAKYVNGTRAYEFARKGSDIELKAQKVNISEIELMSFEMPFIRIRVACSKGTYIRSLARDIGRMLNSGAYLAELRRTRIGDFFVYNAVSISEFEKTLDPVTN
jgi:tRNA pseudouridine55 synthase